MGNSIISNAKNDISRSNQQILTILFEQSLGEDYSDENILNFIRQIEKNNLISNSRLVKKVADYLQLLNSPENCDQVSLEEIGKIYATLIELNPDDISYYESLAYFTDSVLGDSIEAKRIIKIGIDRVQGRLNFLKSEFEI